MVAIPPRPPPRPQRENHFSTDSLTRDKVGEMYLLTVSHRGYNAQALGIVSGPLRRKCWILATPNSEYRAAQGKTDVIPRDGQRYSSHDANSIGTLGAVTPSDFNELDMPESVEADVRLSRGPAHVSVCFLNDGVRNKIPPSA